MSDANYRHQVGFLRTEKTSSEKNLVKSLELGERMRVSYRNDFIEVGLNGTLDYNHSRSQLRSQSNLDTWRFAYGGSLQWNTTWNMETGELITRVLQLVSPYLTISTTGVITSRSVPNGQGVSEESLEIEQAVMRGKRYGTDVGYIDLSADTGSGAVEYDAVIGSNSTLRLEFLRKIDIVDKNNNVLVGYFDGNGWHGPVDNGS